MGDENIPFVLNTSNTALLLVGFSLTYTLKLLFFLLSFQGLTYDNPDVPSVSGRILLYDMSQSGENGAIELEIENFDQREFVPHGISAWVDKTGI